MFLYLIERAAERGGLSSLIWVLLNVGRDTCEASERAKSYLALLMTLG